MSATPTPPPTAPADVVTDAATVAAHKDPLIEYPSRFPYKVMGVKADGFVHALTAIAQEFDPSFDASTIELRPSAKGNYIGVTLTITATSREQLDGMYRALAANPMVKVVL